MEYTTLGSTGVRVSKLCLGTWRFGKESDGVVETTREEAHDLLDAAWDRGINFVDTANGYGGGRSERWIGDWLADRDREDVVVASKVYYPVGDRPNDRGLSRKHIRAQVDAMLDRLGTDYLDVLYCHRWDDATPVGETLRTLDDLVREGRIHYLGASLMPAWKLTKALWTSDVDGRERFEVTQPLYHAAVSGRVPDSDSPANVEEYVDVCADQGLAVCPYSPLAGGFLTGKYDRGDDGGIVGPDGSRATLESRFRDPSDKYYVSERSWAVLDAVRAVADDLGATPAQVALRWLIDQDRFTCVPIVGARTLDQLDENVGAADVRLPDGAFERIANAGDGG